MKMMLAEAVFQRVNIAIELPAIPRAGDFVETLLGVFIVDKVVFRPGKKEGEEVILLVNYK